MTDEQLHLSREISDALPTEALKQQFARLIASLERPARQGKSKRYARRVSAADLDFAMKLYSGDKEAR